LNDVEFLELDVVLFLHDQALREYGGIQGVRDFGALESALGRPQNRLVYGEAVDLFDLAAALTFGLARNHPFNDGNKRTAWGCCVLFLRVNEIRLRRGAMAVIPVVLRLAEGTLDEDGFAAWLRLDAPVPD
jgi:death-on-curing protein